MPTGKWLANHGFQVDGMCLHGCGAEDDVVHRLTGGNEERMGKQQAEALLAGFGEGVRALDLPPGPVRLTLCPYIWLTAW